MLKYIICHWKGHSHRSMKLQPIAKALSPEKTAALPAFHAITGADNAGSLSGKGKVSCWKAFLEADDSVLNALAKLGREEQPGTDIKVGIERFVCQLYLPRTDITTVKELRWFLFRKKQAESDKLSSTKLYCVHIFNCWFGTRIQNQILSYHHLAIMDGQWRTQSGSL